MASGTGINGKILFTEVQYFRVKWLWILLLSIVIFSIFLPLLLSLVTKAGLKESVLSLLVTVPLEGLMLCLFYIVRLETVVSDDGVYYRWLPFFRRYKFIARNDIETAIAGNGPILSYGFHFVLGYGWVHNTGPGKGIRFNLIGGKRIFIGTKDIDSFVVAVAKMINRKQ
ncbi:MAG: hypothetical protein JSS70_10615 [Bacteroidetes bacterium]|nr:hypothetical protein [Bacteroidota bacterium]